VAPATGNTGACEPTHCERVIGWRFSLCLFEHDQPFGSDTVRLRAWLFNLWIGRRRRSQTMRSSMACPSFWRSCQRPCGWKGRRFGCHRLPLARSPRAGEAWSPEAV